MDGDDERPHLRREPITWSIHASTSANGDSGSESSDAESESMSGPSRRRPDRPSAQGSQSTRPTLAEQRDALIPSPPPQSPSRPPRFDHLINMPYSRRQVMVSDIKNRSCWICSDGDEDDRERQPQAKERKWIHPCKCSLVAHQECLVMWIRTRRQQDVREVIKCPQCSQPYTIEEGKPGILTFFERTYQMLNDALPFATAGVVGGGVLFTATAYGCAAIRLWMGKEAAERALGRRWPAHFYFDIPMIPFALIMSRFNLFNEALAWLPSLALYPIFRQSWVHHRFFLGGVAPNLHHRIWNDGRRRWDVKESPSMIDSSRSWPPTPATSLLLLPWVRAIYIALKWRVTRKVLKPFSRKRSSTAGHGSTPPSEAGRAPDNAFPRNLRRVQIVFTNAELPAELDEEGMIQTDDDGNPRIIPPGAEAVGANRTTLVSPRSIIRLVLGALGSPVVANVMGRLLANCAKYNGLLRRFLGMEAFTISKAPSTSGKGSTKSSIVSSAPPSRTPIGNLLATGSMFPSDNGSTSNAASSSSVLSPISLQDEWMDDDYQPIFSDLDPVWFRNTLGFGLFIVAKDIVQLTYRYYRLDHARRSSQRTTVVDMPLVGGVIDQFELRD